VGTIAAQHTSGTAHLHIEAGAREQLPLLCDRTTIAIESLRTQWRTLASLGTHERMAISQLRVYGAMPMSELASRISLSRAAVTSLIDRLEADGWVRRESDEHDRRRTVLRLEPRAATEFDDVAAPFHSDLVELGRSLSDDEWSTISTFLDRIGALAERHARDLRATAAERSLD
jgi:DNA-binding MarR family transcriptional regulator